MATDTPTLPTRPHLTKVTWSCLISSLLLFIADFIFRQQERSVLEAGLNQQLLKSSGEKLKRLNLIQVQDLILTIALILSIQALVELVIKSIRVANYLLTLRITAVLVLLAILYFSFTPTASIYKEMAHNLFGSFDQLFLPLVIAPQVSKFGSCLSILKYVCFTLAVLSIPPFKPLISPWTAQKIKTNQQTTDDQNPCDQTRT